MMMWNRFGLGCKRVFSVESFKNAIKYTENFRRIVISRKLIFFFPVEIASTVQENFIKLSTFSPHQLGPPGFIPRFPRASKCIRFHACSIRFSGSCGRGLRGTVREVSLFTFNLSQMKWRAVNPVSRPCCIIFLGMGFPRRIGRHQMIGSR